MSSADRNRRERWPPRQGKRRTGPQSGSSTSPSAWFRPAPRLPPLRSGTVGVVQPSGCRPSRVGRTERTSTPSGGSCVSSADDALLAGQRRANPHCHSTDVLQLALPAGPRAGLWRGHRRWLRLCLPFDARRGTGRSLRPRRRDLTKNLEGASALPGRSRVERFVPDDCMVLWSFFLGLDLPQGFMDADDLPIG